MKWASSAQSGAILGENLARAADDLRRQLGGATPDLLFAFATAHFTDAYPYLPDLLREQLPHRTLAGCSAAGVIGSGRELENQPALALVAAVLPGVRVQARHIETDALPDGDAPPGLWRDWLGVAPSGTAHTVILTDPFSTQLEPLLTGLDYALPGGAKVGGLASAGRAPGQNALFANGQVHRSGALLVTLEGALRVDTVVAQGCRPVGEPLVVTRCERNLLLEVNRELPLKYLGQLVEQLAPADRELMRTSLFLGLKAEAADDGAPAGDYLIRNLTGIDYERGVLAVGSMLQEGQLVQFHLRDRTTSAVDLDRLLARHAPAASDPPPAGALLFSCVGRGRQLYGRPDHDSEVFRSRVGRVPLGGFFCSGEIGPVAGSTQAHGYTSAFALIRPASSAS